MKFLYASNLYPPSTGGAQIHLHSLAKAMQSAGNEVSVVTHSCRHRTDWLRLSTVSTEPESHFDYEGVPVWQLGFSPFARIQIMPWALAYYGLTGLATRNISRHALRALSSLPTPDVVHATRIGREFLCRAALDFAHKHGRPFVLTPVHHPRWDGWRYTEYDKIYREADALCVLTKEEKRLLVEQKQVDAEKIHVTGIGPVLSSTYDAEEFRRRYDIRGPFVLYLGQQFRYKGVGALLEAAPLVWKRHPDVTFVFIGPQTRYSKTVFSVATDRRVRNLGEVSLETKTAALSCCEFLCLPSSQESFGGVYVEAWALGKAVIGGRIPPIAELISEGQDGLLSSQNPSEIAEQISLLIADPERCKKMGKAGARKVESRYTWAQIAKKTEDVYRASLGEKPSIHHAASYSLR
jgi:glycosyltransferase involved in cell wall biosynthesis